VEKPLAEVNGGLGEGGFQGLRVRGKVYKRIQWERKAEILVAKKKKKSKRKRRESKKRKVRISQGTKRIERGSPIKYDIQMFSGRRRDEKSRGLP